ncbi:hypothetical protein Tco_0174341 [Tanacetum coccineum]
MDQVRGILEMYDNLTISMNYVPVVAGNQTNGIVGTRDNIVTGQAEKKTEPEQEYILILICITKSLISQYPKGQVKKMLKKILLSMIGSLMYLTASRPDIMCVVYACAMFQVTPKMSHLHAVTRIFRYFKGQPKLGLWYPRDSPFYLEAFFDSKYAGASLDRKSITEGCQFLGNVLWIQNQMLDYGFNFMNTKIFIDNESTICIVKNPVFHSKTKHIEIRHHFIRDCYEKKLIQVIKIHTDHNVIDLLTKAFDVSRKSKIFSGKVTPLVDSMLVQNQAPEGEGSAIPPEPQPTPSTSQPNASEPQTESLQTEKPPTVSHELQTEAHIEQILPSPSIYQRKQRKSQKHRRAKQVTTLPQTSMTLDHGVDEAVQKEGGGSVERAITTDASLVAAHDSDNIIRTQTTAMPNVDIPQGIYTGGSPRRQETIGGALAQTRSERVLEKPNEPPLPEGHTSGSGEGSMEHTFELTDIVPPTPHDSPLIGGYTPGSDKGRLKLKELMAICTKLSKQVLDLEKEKDAQAVGIPLKLKQRVKKFFFLKVRRKSSISHPIRGYTGRLSHSDDDLDERKHQTGDGKSITTLQPLPTIDPKDKGKGVLVEEESKKPKKVKKKGSRQEEATSAALVEEFDEIQARINADHELAKQLAVERAEAITNKPPIRTQVRNMMITYLKHMGNYTHQQLKHKIFEEVQKLYEREKKWIDDFKTIDDDSQHQSESTKKRPRENSEEESSKKQKLEEDNDAEKEELRDSMDVFPRDDVAIDFESLATKYLIVNWKTHILNENMMYYQINRADGSSKNYKIFSEMLDDFDRQDVIDLHRLVNERYEITSPEGYDLLLWGDLKTLFELFT